MSSPLAPLMGLTMLFAGICIPFMAALNSELGARLGNPVAAAALLFTIALAATIIVLLLQPLPMNLQLIRVPPELFLGGLIVAFYVVSISFIAPAIGVGNAILLVLLGQMLAAAAIDHFAWFGALREPLTGSRFGGMLLLFIGALLTQR